MTCKRRTGFSDFFRAFYDGFFISGLQAARVVFADYGLEFFAEEPARLVADLFFRVEKDGVSAAYAYHV